MAKRTISLSTYNYLMIINAVGQEQKNVTHYFVPVRERGCAIKALYKNNPVFLLWVSLLTVCFWVFAHFFRGKQK